MIFRCYKKNYTEIYLLWQDIEINKHKKSSNQTGMYKNQILKANNDDKYSNKLLTCFIKITQSDFITFFVTIIKFIFQIHIMQIIHAEVLFKVSSEKFHITKV